MISGFKFFLQAASVSPSGYPGRLAPTVVFVCSSGFNLPEREDARVKKRADTLKHVLHIKILPRIHSVKKDFKN